jgi:hypothetical protein
MMTADFARVDGRVIDRPGLLHLIGDLVTSAEVRQITTR